jgi:DnaK suppressor protein
MVTSRNLKKTRTAMRTTIAKSHAVKSKAARLARPRRAASQVTPPNGRLGSKMVNADVDGRAQLQKERAQVESELAALRAELLEAPEMTGDEVDLNVYEREKTLGLVTAYERRLEEINAALRATAEGTYGVCERCGNPIDPERLKIFPEARLCVRCKSEKEKEARRLRL